MTIFQEGKGDLDSEIIFIPNEDVNDSVRKINGKKFYYLIEVFIAREFIEDWKVSLEYPQNEKEIAKRLYEYAINDA